MNPSKIWMQENHFGDIGVVKMILVEFLEILVHKCSTSPHSDFWHYIACLALSSLQKPCRHFIWTQLFSPLAPSVMTFLFQPEQRRHSPFSIVGWKLISSRGMSCHPLSFPSAVSSPSIFVWKQYISCAFYFSTWHIYLTQLLSHMLLPGRHGSGAHSLHSASHPCFGFVIILVINWGIFSHRSYCQ